MSGTAAIAAEKPEPPDQIDATEVAARKTMPLRDGSAPFAIVELFTSESCPSCPTADKLLSEMGAEARKKGQRILPLAFHVDYWNKGIAADAFSSTAFALRQKAYAAAFESEDIYTPQMVVNGNMGFVGNERATAERQIKAALGRPAAATVKITLDEARRDSSTIRVKCEFRTTSTAANLQVAVVERNVSPRNGHGKKLDNVVRVFKTVPLSKGSYQTVELQMPDDLVRKNASVVGYIQDSHTMAVLGANSVDLDVPAVQRVASAGE